MNDREKFFDIVTVALEQANSLVFDKMMIKTLFNDITPQAQLIFDIEKGKAIVDRVGQKAKVLTDLKSLIKELKGSNLEFLLEDPEDKNEI